MKASKVLAICCRPENHDDFVAIGKRIIRKAPEIAVVIKPITYHPNELDPALQHYPLLNLYLVNPPKVLPARGRTLHVKRIDKFEQYQHYVIANISTPKTIEYEIGQGIDINEWGDILSTIFSKHINIYSDNVSEFKTYFAEYKRIKTDYKIPYYMLEYIENDTEFKIYCTQKRQEQYINFWKQRTKNVKYENIPDSL